MDHKDVILLAAATIYPAVTLELSAQAINIAKEKGKAPISWTRADAYRMAINIALQLELEVAKRTTSEWL